MTRALVLDLARPVPLDGLPTEGIDRVVLPHQVSPARREAIARRWPGAEVRETPPASDGPWQARVTEDLARLAAVPVLVHDVPVLDCFRAAWREDLALRRALEAGLAGATEAIVPAGGPVAGILRRVATRGGLEEVREVPAPDGAREPGLFARIRRAGPRGVALALAVRWDPSGLRRARCRLSRPFFAADAVAVSSYVNATRAAFEAVASLAVDSALHVRSGPGALGGLGLPPNVRSVPLSAAIARDIPGAKRAVRDARAGLADTLDALSTDDPWNPFADDASTPFRRRLASGLLPEVAAAIAGFRALFQDTSPRHVVVGDEFSFVDRAALHVARASGIATVSRQHGVLDSHYRRDEILADVHLAWDEGTIGWLEGHDALPAGRAARTLPRALPPAPARSRDARTIAVFLQPLEMVGVPTADWLAETIPAVAAEARAAGSPLVVKLHPLQTRAGVEAALPGGLPAPAAFATDPSARSLLATAAAAVTLDSSVAVDCRDAGVPCFSTAWYEGTYAKDLARLGWVVPCETPEALGRALREVLARRASS